MIGLVAVVPTSDTFASVLMGIPVLIVTGDCARRIPFSKKGQAARALSAAFTSSLFGGLVGATFLTFFILVARPIVLMFQSPELLMVAVFGVSMVGILAGRVALKGLAAAGLGMMIAMIGEGPFNGQPRLTSYDYPYFLDGLQLVIVGLGIFAIPEVIALSEKEPRSISGKDSAQDGSMESKIGGSINGYQYVVLSRCSCRRNPGPGRLCG